MKELFAPCTIGGLELKNRLIRSATHEGLAEEGKVGDALLNAYDALSQGELGLLITGYAKVSATDHAGSTTLDLTDDAVLPGLQRLAQVAHGQGTKIMAQLNHASTSLWQAPDGPVYGPSAVQDPVSGLTAQPFTQEEVQQLTQEFANAAERAQKAGFDGVQVHSAHGYLFSKWLSPRYNQRSDEYGGDPASRAGIIVETLQAIKTRCGEEFPVWIKLNSSDFVADGNGVTEELFLATAKILADAGIDAIEVSGGTREGEFLPSRSRQHVAYHLSAAEELANRVDTDVILVGGIRTPDKAEEILATTKIAGLSLSRPLIREPQLAKRWASGDRSEVACIACNGCFNPTGTRCFFDLNEQEQAAQKEIMKMLAKR